MLTDSNPLTYAFCGNHKSYSSSEIRPLEYVPMFYTDVRFVTDLDNAAADALSRVPAVTLSPPLLHLEKLAASQWDDSELQFLQVSSKSLVLRTVSHPCHLPPWFVTPPEVLQGHLYRFPFEESYFLLFVISVL